MKIVIMAGGKGTRIASVNAEVPKPMIEILGKPILEYQIECLKKQGYKDIILVVGHLGHIIQEYFGDGSKISPATGKPFGVNIKYIAENEPLGTAGALYLIKDELINDDDAFMLINGDIIFDIDIIRFYNYHKSCGSLATIFTHPNSHPYDSGIIEADNNGCVVNWLHKEDERLWYRNRVNAGIHILSPKVFNAKADLGIFNELKKIDLDRDVLKPLVKIKQLYVYDSPEYVKDMGTPERYFEVTEDIKSGKVAAKNLFNKQRAVFLDRDGVINEYVGFLRNINEFKIIDNAAEAIKKINMLGYLAIVITNQPVIARGEVSFEELREIHNKMETLLGQKGAYIDAIYFCPHHPHKGYEGEIAELKFDCDCRKPKPGMILKAAKDFNIDLSLSWMVGDGENDIKAGIAAECKTALVGNDENKYGQDVSVSSLLEFVDKFM